MSMRELPHEDDVMHEPGTSVEPPALAPPEPEPPRAWIVAYGELGLINVVADSQKELVERFEVMRSNALRRLRISETSPLQAIEVLPNNPDAPGATTIWIDPLLIQAVLDPFVPHREPTRAEVGLPPGLEALLENARQAVKVSGDAIAEVEVFVDEGEPRDE